jgi:hypothetical protein
LASVFAFVQLHFCSAEAGGGVAACPGVCAVAVVFAGGSAVCAARAGDVSIGFSTAFGREGTGD